MHITSETQDAYRTWMRFATAYTQMSMSATEVIVRRSMRMATGAMTPAESVGMVMEKATAFAAAGERAALAAARGGNAVRIAEAALKPIGARTQANVRKLRG